MDSTQSATTLALAVVAAKVGFSWCKKWYHSRSLRQRVIEHADFEQTVYEMQELVADEADDVSTPMSRRKKGVYRTYLVKEGKAKFGTPKDNIANRMVVRKYLYDQCKNDGLIARHIADHLDIATALVFVPSKNEIIAAAISSTTTSQSRSKIMDEFLGTRPDFA